MKPRHDENMMQVGQAARIELHTRNIVITFGKVVQDEVFTIMRAKGKFGDYQMIGTLDDTTFVDEKVGGRPFDFYYQIINSNKEIVSELSLEQTLFGPNFHVYQPGDSMDAIAKEINDIHDLQYKKEFSDQRYAFYFKTGDYTQAAVFNIPYYVHIGGLGKTPYEVKINNIHTPAPLANNNATCTFWRSAENLSIIGPKSDDPLETFMWGVSQAAPIRRIYSERHAYYQWMTDGWGSGGFTADCHFDGAAGSFTQQQWYTRNSYIKDGKGKFATGGWNLAYQGVEFGSKVDLTLHSDNWENSGERGYVSRIETTPVIREKPFLFYDSGRYKVFKPALRVPNSHGISYSRKEMGKGDIYDLLDDFFVVKPGTAATEMNKNLEAGKHLFITPGIYELSEPLHIKKANTIVLGTGLATLIPSDQNKVAAIVVDDVDGVTVASLLFDAHYSSKYLLRVGDEQAVRNHRHNPSLFADLFFRVGGFQKEDVEVEIALEINSDDVIGDHFWIWRADHGAGVGWFKNKAKNGLVVNGDHVTIYGLFNEHFQEYQTLWNGEKGQMYFYQCETPYDVIDQRDYMSHKGTRKGYAAYKVAEHVNYHDAFMLGIYDVFTKTQGAEIAIENAIEVSDSIGVKVHHACNVCISPLGGIHFVINGIEKSTFNTNIADRFFVVDYNGTKEAHLWERKN